MAKKAGGQKKRKWVTVKDGEVRNVWTCDEEGCKERGEETHIDPSWYADNGTPVCGGCDRDMCYVRTEVRK
jgi:hypothetical protein